MIVNIYTVTFNSERFLLKNYNLLKYLNPDLEFRWFVVDHSPNGRILDKPEFIVCNKKNVPNGLNSGNQAHGGGLNYLKDKANKLNLYADYHLTIDPDFYLFVPIQYLIDKDKDVVGGQYPDKAGTNYPHPSPMLEGHMYFYPTAFCSLFNNSTVDFYNLDFMCDIQNYPVSFAGRFEFDVGWKVLKMMKDGILSYEMIGDCITYTNFMDAYFTEDMLTGMHVRQARHRGHGLATQADKNLNRLGEFYNRHRKEANKDIEWNKI